MFHYGCLPSCTHPWLAPTVMAPSPSSDSVLGNRVCLQRMRRELEIIHGGAALGVSQTVVS